MRLQLTPFLAFLASLALSAVKPNGSAAQSAPSTRPTLWLVGDSTVRNGSGTGANAQWGWGDRIGKFFDKDRINVVNRARGGRSSRTFITEGLWDAVLKDAKSGDFVIIQLGHNDGGPLAGDNRERGSLRGVGDESEDVTLTLKPNEGKKETVHTYGWYLRRLVTDARAHGMSPIVCSPIPRRPKLQSDLTAAAAAATQPTTKPTGYNLWSRQVAESEHVPFVDLNTIVVRHYAESRLTPQGIKVEYFTEADDTHTSEKGADLNAACVVEGLKSLPDGPLRSYLIDSTRSVIRTFPLREGNYNVTVTFGSEDFSGTTTVLAEQRRLMIEKVRTKQGEHGTRTFTVNVRTPDIPSGGGGGGRIKLKPREANYPNWDDKLTLQFLGDPPAIASVKVEPAESDKTITLFIAGDSTVTDQEKEPYNSWGQMLPRWFKAGVAVANYAESGESIRSSLAAHRFDKIFAVMRPKDYLFIQFGHNDMKEKGEGVGAFTTYKADLERLLARAAERGGRVVLVTSMNRRNFDDAGHVYSTLKDYPDAVRTVARDKNLPLIDLNAMSKPLYEAWGPEKSKLAFAPGDNTHHNDYGSYELSRCVVENIRRNQLADLAEHLTDDVRPFDPAHPDPMDSFDLPEVPTTAPATKPEGS
jgi:lysophospholipase L1-like esterase